MHNFYERNYYCNGFWFQDYEHARKYAEHILKTEGKYRVVFTKAERDATINHEQECGK